MGSISYTRPEVKSDTGWLFPQVLYHYCPSIFCKQDSLQVKGFVTGLASCFFFCSLQSTFLHQRDKNKGVRALCRHQFKFSMFNEVCGCCSWQWHPPCQFLESNILSQHALESLPGDMTLVESSSLYQGSALGSPSYIPETFYCTSFPHHPSISPLNSSHLFPYPPPLPNPHPLHLFPLLLSLLDPHTVNEIHLPFPGRSLCPPTQDPSSLPNIFESTLYSWAIIYLMSNVNV